MRQPSIRQREVIKERLSLWFFFSSILLILLFFVALISFADFVLYLYECTNTYNTSIWEGLEKYC